MVLVIGFEGWLAIAQLRGLKHYTVTFEGTGETLTAICDCVWKDEEVQERYTLNEVLADKPRRGAVWEQYPDRMLARHAAVNSIKNYLKKHGISLDITLTD